jgi:aryl-alcohol dehydrogenase-like predicted oxidoreductase
MRYRPFTPSGLSTSAVTLAVPALREHDAFKLICAALEHGINSFDIAAGDEAAAAALGRAIPSVGRNVIVLTLTIERVDRSEDIFPLAKQALRATGAQYLDALVLREDGAPTEVTRRQIQSMKAARRLRLAGVAADGDGADQALAAPGLDLLGTSYNVSSGWPERNRIKAAGAQGMTIVGRNFHIDPARPAKVEAAKGLGRLFKKAPAPQVQRAYDFMSTTPGWTSEQISLVYALSEPALATVRVETASIPLLGELAEAVDKVLPSNVATQIELARVASLADASAA